MTAWEAPPSRANNTDKAPRPARPLAGCVRIHHRSAIIIIIAGWCGRRRYELTFYLVRTFLIVDALLVRCLCWRMAFGWLHPTAPHIQGRAEAHPISLLASAGPTWRCAGVGAEALRARLSARMTLPVHPAKRVTDRSISTPLQSTRSPQ